MLDSSTLDQNAREEIQSFVPELTVIRRDIHEHPEMGLEEVRTAAIVAEKLRSWGIETTTGIGRTGVVGTIRGTRPGQRAIGLRADMDALPIREETGLPYASKTPGVMHACGHDGHTTMLLGAARYLAGHRDFAGTVHLIFQPAEEGRGGAVAMIEDKLFERFPCDAVYGMHNGPGIPLGKFAIRKGPFMAGGCSWRTVFTAKGTHGGSTPHLSADLSVVAAHFILALQTVVGRNVPPLDTAVISVGGIEAGSLQAGNVMPSRLEMVGTARYFRPQVREIIDTRIRELAQQIAAMHGAGCTVDVTWMSVPVDNKSEQTDVAIAAAQAVVGTEAVDGKANPITGGEDFSFMMEKCPGAFIFAGNGTRSDGSYANVHTPKYDFNDALLPLGVAYWVSLVREELGLKV